VTSSGRYSLLQKVAALAPLLLMLAYTPGQALLRCRIDGSIRTACCCAEGQSPASPGPVARPQDCCDREISVNAPPVAEAPGSGAVEIAPLLTALAPVALLPAPPALQVDRGRQSQAPPASGPPVVLLKHAFLI
jgi:hypothetical protein